MGDLYGRSYAGLAKEAADRIAELEAEVTYLRTREKIQGAYIEQVLDKLEAEAADRIAELEAQVEALQNKCARRGLSPEDSDALQARVEVLEAAIRWALGEGDAFPMIAEPPYYRWRTELRERARMKYDPVKCHSIATTEQEDE